jgi:hypothetical protein
MSEKTKTVFDFEHLWYLIPGTIVLFPILLKYYPKIEITFGNSALLMLVIYTVGFLIHRLYRICYHIFKIYHRPAIKYLEKK